MEYKQDSADVWNNKNLIRRRFYLSKESLDYVDGLSIEHNLSPSVLLDTILLSLVKQKTVH